VSRDWRTIDLLDLGAESLRILSGQRNQQPT
jgi:hypothetical protein